VCWSEWPHSLREVCNHLPAEIVGSNPAGGMDVVSIVCCQGEVSVDELITHPEEFCRLW